MPDARKVNEHAIEILFCGNLSACMSVCIVLKTELSGFDLCHDGWTRTRRAGDSNKAMDIRRVEGREMRVVPQAGKLYLVGYL